MNNVKCQVTSCQHHEMGKCRLESIKVTGPTAQITEETACASYHKRDGSTTNGLNFAPSVSTYISCDAAHCTYNDNKMCHAESVSIGKCYSGAEGCCACTQCDTYKSK